MRLLLTSFIGLIILFCGVKVKLVDATSQEWYGGRYESGKGTDYVLTLKAKGSSDKLIIDELWVGEDYYEVKAVKNRAKRSDLSFEKRDTIFVTAGKKLKPNENGELVKVSGKNVKAPKDFSGAALLAYTWKGKRKYLEITELRVLEKIIYP
jgi:hypothetical protein